MSTTSQDRTIIVEPTRNAAVVQTIKVETLLAYITPYQVTAEKREV